MNPEINGSTEWILPIHQADLRRSARFDHDTQMVARSAKNPGYAIPGRIIDLSCGGMRAALGAELALEDTLDLEFGLRTTSAIVRLIAVVRWRKGCEYGLEFMYRSSAERERMSQAFAALYRLDE